MLSDIWKIEAIPIVTRHTSIRRCQPVFRESVRATGKLQDQTSRTSQAIHVSSQEKGVASTSFQAPIPGSPSPITLPPEPISNKRKTSTSAPSSPTLVRPEQKRLVLARLLPDLNSTRILSIRPVRVLAPQAWPFAPDRSASVTSRSTDSLASRGHNARALGARARRDASDVRRVLRTIQQVQNDKYKVKKGGPGGKYLVQRTLHHSGYVLLRDFVIHMPSGFHEAMAGGLNTMIVKWLDKIEDGTLCKIQGSKKATMQIASKIRSTLASKVKCSEPRDDRLEPDQSFKYRSCLVAGIVVEVAWSQSNLKLPDRARRCIEGTEGEIRTVIGLNMNDIYLGGRRATFSVWKAEQHDNKWKRVAAVDNKEFISDKGEPISGCKFSLSLTDFLCAETARDLGDFEDNIPLEIPAAKLHEFNQDAFQDHIIEKAMQGTGDVKKETKNSSEEILTAETIIQEQTTENARGRKVMDQENLASVRDILSKVKKYMDMVAEELKMVEKRRFEAETGVAELESKLAAARAGEGDIVEADKGSRRSRVRSALKFSSKK
ncbi:hypothetical protein F4777DRAFT_592191 [Nemania sp. FL0916]|nr:hypothetical protein F4777DRAFT_592191 [Nemania sp. FL0916]